MRRMMKTQTGFTLIEIMLVVGIIALLATFAIPQMLRSRMNANETSAIAAMRTISNAAQSYYNDVIPHTYPPNLLSMASSVPPYIDLTLGQARRRADAKQGYYYVYDQENSENFTVVGRPSFFGRTGERNFFVDETGVVTFNRLDGVDPDENSPVAGPRQG